MLYIIYTYIYHLSPSISAVDSSLLQLTGPREVPGPWIPDICDKLMAMSASTSYGTKHRNGSCATSKKDGTWPIFNGEKL